MEAYAQVLNYAIPFFIGLILIEAIAARKMDLKINRGADIISSLSSGISNIVKDVLGLSVVVISYSWLVEHLALVTLRATWLVYLIGFIVIDFAGYWMHRLSHEVNFLWNRHIIHHSSEEFNLACALRQPISAIFSFIAIFMVPAALLGVPAQVIAVIAPLHLFAQFWYHTRLIHTMGFLEKFLVTPSHHRVHHAINPEYLDKNYGQIFIFWDKWFGTFQAELPSVNPIYGVKRPVNTWNPILINFQHFWLLFQDALRTKNWQAKWSIWFRRTGWRPDDVRNQYPVKVIENLSTYQKYDSYPSTPLLLWSWLQLMATLGFVFYMFHHISSIPFLQLLVYGAYIFTSIFSFTALLDKSRWAVWAESIRFIFGSIILLILGDWFGLDQYQVGLSALIQAFLVLSLATSIWFSYTEVKAFQIQKS